MSKQLQKPFTALYPVPVVLVTCGTGDQANIITLAWVGTVCSDPPMVGISVRPGRHSHALIKETGEFVLNIPTSDMLEIADYCGQVSGRHVDKWTATGLTPEPASTVKPPLIAQCPVNLECKLVQTIELGVHHLFIGEILAVQVDQEILDEKGHINYQKAKPFAYLGGNYWGLGELLGLYGFSKRK